MLLDYVFNFSIKNLKQESYFLLFFLNIVWKVCSDPGLVKTYHKPFSHIYNQLGESHFSFQFSLIVMS